MSLRPNGFTEIPAETSRVARAAFPKGCLAMRARDALGPLFTDEPFAASVRGPGPAGGRPARLALVLVLQFAEDLTDRQAADAVRARLDWKYALGLELTDPGFDFSRAHASSAPAWSPAWPSSGCSTRCWTRLRELGLLRRAGGSAPTPPTCWRGPGAQPAGTGRRDDAGGAGGPGGRGAGLAGGRDRRASGSTLRPARIDDCRLPKSEQARRNWPCGRPGRLPAAGGGLRPGRAGLAGRLPAVAGPARGPGSSSSTSTQARSAGRGQAAAACHPAPADPRPLRSWMPAPASNAAAPGAAIRPTSPRPAIPAAPPDHPCGHHRCSHRRPGHRPRPPRSPRRPRPTTDTHLVDAGYVSVGQILAAADDHGVQLIGPLPPDTSWQAGDDDAFDLTRFRHRLRRSPRAPAPRGKTSRNWQPARAATACRSSGPPSGSRTAAPAPTGHAAPAPRTTPGT